MKWLVNFELQPRDRQIHQTQASVNHLTVDYNICTCKIVCTDLYVKWNTMINFLKATMSITPNDMMFESRKQVTEGSYSIWCCKNRPVTNINLYKLGVLIVTGMNNYS